jgi:tetratricopeptide (TPR) repeat protein
MQSLWPEVQVALERNDPRLAIALLSNIITREDSKLNKLTAMIERSKILVMIDRPIEAKRDLDSILDQTTLQAPSDNFLELRVQAYSFLATLNIADINYASQLYNLGLQVAELMYKRNKVYGYYLVDLNFRKGILNVNSDPTQAINSFTRALSVLQESEPEIMSHKNSDKAKSIKRYLAFNRGLLYYQRGKYDLAKNDFLRLGPFEGHLLMAHLYYKDGFEEKFKAHLIKGLSHPPQYSNDQISETLVPIITLLINFTPMKSSKLNPSPRK